MSEGITPPEVIEAAEIHNKEAAAESEPQPTENKEALTHEQEMALSDWAYQRAESVLMSEAYRDIPEYSPDGDMMQAEADKVHEAFEVVSDFEAEVRNDYYSKVIAQETEKAYVQHVYLREDKRLVEHKLKEKSENVPGSVAIEEINEAVKDRALAARAAFNIRQFGMRRAGVNESVFNEIDDENNPARI